MAELPSTAQSKRKIAYLDPVSGISGDMLLGALVDSGLDVEDLRRALNGLHVDGYRLEARKVTKAGISATKVDVIVDGEGDGRVPGGSHSHGHGAPPPDRGHRTAPQHEHRGLKEVLGVLERSALPDSSKELAGRIFRALASAEGKVHGISPDEVHFHEVGAVDAIVDVVGAVEGFRLLGVDQVLCGPLPVASGKVRASHGIIPLPAPATVELLRGFPVREAAGEFEMVTPTGAAIVAALSKPCLVWPRMIPRAVGYGAGSRDLDTPNVLRVVLGDSWEPSWHPALADAEIKAAGDLGLGFEEALVLECNIDDMNPQFYGYVQDRLLDLGALDVFLEPLYMKKGRPATKLSVLCRPEDVGTMVETLMRETTTIGVRGYKTYRWMARREIRKIETPYGNIRIKLAYLGDRVVNAAPEYDDCRQAAESCGIPLKTVHDAAVKGLGAE